MSALDSFKVDKAPAAFAPTSSAHNRLVDLVENIVGDKGVKVTVSEGRILIEFDADTAGDRASGSEPMGPPSGYHEKDVTICEDGSPVVYTFLVKN